MAIQDIPYEERVKAWERSRAQRQRLDLYSQIEEIDEGVITIIFENKEGDNKGNEHNSIRGN